MTIPTMDWRILFLVTVYVENMLKILKIWLLDQLACCESISMRELQPMGWRCECMGCGRLERCDTMERCVQRMRVDGWPWQLGQWLEWWLVLSGSQHGFGGSQRLEYVRQFSIHGILEQDRRPMGKHHGKDHLEQQQKRQWGQTTPTDLTKKKKPIRTNINQLFKLEPNFLKKKIKTKSLLKQFYMNSELYFNLSLISQ